MSTFADLGVSRAVSEALAKRSIREPFPIQALVIPDAVTGRDVLARSRTGSGKTLAFGIPVVERLDPNGGQPSCLVLVPTRELAEQVHEELTAIGAARNLKVAPVFGGVSLRDQARRAARAHIVVATPGRLYDLMERKMVSLGAVEILVLDEADRMLDMGFQPQVDRILRHVPDDRQTMFFSATLDGQVGSLARSYTRDPATHSIESPRLTVDEADHRFVPVKGDKVNALVTLLATEKGATLVFVRTKRGADRLVHRLQRHGVSAAAMHGDLTQTARRKALDEFEKGKVDVLVATDVAARGLDLDHIAHVVNFDPPHDDKGYVHRVGRTARAGRAGVGTTLVTPDQQADVSRMAARLKLDDEFKKEGMEVSPPRIVYSSHGNRSMMRSRRKRKF